ncbi:MAG: hypothetical protein FWH28_02810, partial [Clostridiales bacterium]|nr:hypothetical protein [Clostridiales bacterium]
MLGIGVFCTAYLDETRESVMEGKNGMSTKNDIQASETKDDKTIGGKSPGAWIANQLKEHKARSAAVIVPTAAALIVGILWFCGAFIPKEHWDYLPNRAYSLAPVEEPEPQTLAELLRSDNPSIESLLKNPAIAEEIIKAESVSDIVSSRRTLNNLSELDRQITAWIEEMPGQVYMLDLPDEEGGTAPEARVEPAAEATQATAGTAGAGMQGGAATAAIAPGTASSGESTITVATPGLFVPGDTAFVTAAQALLEQGATLSSVQSAIQRLTAPSPFVDDTMPIPPAINLKGIWQDGEALLHLMPEADWLTESGYTIYRIIDGQSELIAEGIAAIPALGESPDVSRVYDDPQDWESIQYLYREADLRSKQASLGMSEAQFREKFYVTNPLIPQDVFSGAEDFVWLRETLRTRPGSIDHIDQLIPQLDKEISQPILVMDKQLVAGGVGSGITSGLSNGSGGGLSAQTNLWAQFSVVQDRTMRSSNAYLALMTDAQMEEEIALGRLKEYRFLDGRSGSGMPDRELLAAAKQEQLKRKAAQEVLEARQQLATLSYVDSEFAEAAELLIHDDLAALGLEAGTPVLYRISAPGSSVSASLELTYGVEFNLSQPRGLDGIGIDGLVMLRWDEADMPESGIIIGYDVERKLTGENEFTKRNEVPVAISHMLDDRAGYMESVVFFEEEVENGVGAQYRIRALDIFGRAGGYSEVFVINGDSPRQPAVVEKVTPPNTPGVGAPVTSAKITEELSGGSGAGASISEAVQASHAANQGINGVILPIYTESEDAVRFTVYRAVAVGAEAFGPPVPIADLLYDNPLKAIRETEEAARAAQAEAAATADSAGSTDSSSSTDGSSSTGNAGSARNAILSGALTQAAPQPAAFTYNVHKVSALAKLIDSVTGKPGAAAQLTLESNTPGEPNLVFYDSDIQEGRTYKYWVSAWDDPEWSNESAWSQAVSVSLPTKDQPQSPATESLKIKMLLKELPELSELPPGIMEDSALTGQSMDQPYMQDLMQERKLRRYSPLSVDVIDTATFQEAENAGVTIGSFTTGTTQVSLASVASEEYDTLPADRYIHTFVAVRGEDLKPGGGALLKWPAYSGGGLKGYILYKPMRGDLPDLKTMQQMTLRELTQLCAWKKVNDYAITQNQVYLSGGLTGEALNLFLVCLEPENDITSAQYISDTLSGRTGNGPDDELVEPVEPIPPQEPPYIYVPAEPVRPVAPAPPALKPYSHPFYSTTATISVNNTGNGLVTFTINRGSGAPSVFTMHAQAQYNNEYAVDPYHFILLCLEDVRNILPSYIGTTNGIYIDDQEFYFIVGIFDSLYDQFYTDYYIWKEKNALFQIALANYEEKYSAYMDARVQNDLNWAYYEEMQRRYDIDRAEYDKALAAYKEAVYKRMITGYVQLKWDRPDDPQVKYFRIYRAEVPDFSVPVEEDSLEWIMVGDLVTEPCFTDPVEQVIAHYYYYKVSAVSSWGVETTVSKTISVPNGLDTIQEIPAGAIQPFRVPATMPPATPVMQLPLSSKNGVKVNFSAVGHVDHYRLYRTEVTRLTEGQIQAIMEGNEDVFGALFQPISVNDAVLSRVMANSLRGALGTFSDGAFSGGAFSGGRYSFQSADGQMPVPSYTLLGASPTASLMTQVGAFPVQIPSVLTPVQAQIGEISALSKFMTVSQVSEARLRQSLAAVSQDKQIRLVRQLVDTYGPLVLADYADLSYDLMRKVVWEEVGGPLDAGEEKLDENGLLAPLSIEDKTAVYGHMYLYTVRAWNDDNLGSPASEPVKGASRRKGPFDPIRGIRGVLEEIDNAGTLAPFVTWNPPTMAAEGLTVEQCKEDTVGYIVYRADTQAGPYYQNSPLLFNTFYIDGEANVYTDNWYNVKVLDTGGYLSEFDLSSSVNVRRPAMTPMMAPFIPDDLLPDEPDEPDEGEAPVLTFPEKSFSIRQGVTFQTNYSLAGGEADTVSVVATGLRNASVPGFTLDLATRMVHAPDNLEVGMYTVTATAKNEYGESSDSFLLTVEAATTSPALEPPLIAIK